MFKPTLLAAALTLFLAVPAYAQSYDTSPLDLTSYQSEQIRQIRSQNQGLLREVVQLGQELQQACADGDSYRQDQIQRELQSLKPQVKSMHREINQVLTSQQRRQAKQISNQLEDRLQSRNRCDSVESGRTAYSPSYDSGRTYNGTYNRDDNNYNAYAYQPQAPYTSYDSRYGNTPNYPSTNYAPNYGGYPAQVPYGSSYGSPYGSRYGQQQDVGSALLNQVLFSVLNQVLLKP